ncbi:MAG: DUF1311 domain-containing protein [Vampirovibrio sp.]|nr:DUF1311 domain-containing protein [Vampirovibrio sp.]
MKIQISQQFVTTCCFTFLFFNTATAADCPNDPITTLDFRRCNEAEYQQVDITLNHTYQDLKSKLDKEGIQKLVTAEKSWIAFRDTHCAFESDTYRGGTLAPVIYGSCLITLTRSRTKELQAILDTYYSQHEPEATTEPDTTESQ